MAIHIHVYIHTGAGIYARISDETISSGPIANNGLVVASNNNRLWLECVSDTDESDDVGIVTTSNGRNMMSGMNSGIWSLTNPYERPGVLRLQAMSMNAMNRGIYTCTISDINDRKVLLNVGLYEHGYNGELIYSKQVPK